MSDVRHGTYAGYQAETRLRVPHCDLCRAANREYLREWRRTHRATSVGRYTLTVCAAGYGRPDLGLVVCGLPPHHQGPHIDVQWPVVWAGEPS